jgi:hypothetical protein
MVRIMAQRDIIRQGVAIHVLQQDKSGTDVLQPHEYQRDALAFYTHNDGEILPAPVFTLDQRAAQHLMDDLYNAGLRPTDAQGTAGQLEAMKAHLDDMRKAYELVLTQAKLAATSMMFIQEPTR